MKQAKTGFLSVPNQFSASKGNQNRIKNSRKCSMPDLLPVLFLADNVIEGKTLIRQASYKKA
jgi:hypothetical protein